MGVKEMKTIISLGELGINRSWVTHGAVLLLIPMLCGTLCSQDVPACFVVASSHNLDGIKTSKTTRKQQIIICTLSPAIALHICPLVIY